MAKRQVKYYKFTPGTAGNGKIVLPGKQDLYKLLLITNVTRGTILYNFADTANTGATIQFYPGGVPTNDSDYSKVTYGTDLFGVAGTAQLQNVPYGQGETIITITGVDTSTHDTTDKLSIFIEEQYQLVRTWHDFGTDAIERQRVSQPQAQIDADFEYGLQGTKWQGFELVNNYPSVFEQTGIDLPVTSVQTDGATTSNIIVRSDGHGLISGSPFTIQNLDTQAAGFTRAQGTGIVFFANTNYFSYYAKGTVTAEASVSPLIQSPRTTLRKGGFYSGSQLNATSLSTNGANPSVITVNFGSAHGFTPGMPLLISANTTNNGSQFVSLPGAYYANNFPTASSVTFTARGQVTIGGGSVTPDNLNNTSSNQIKVYTRPDGFFLHRPGDGGILLGTSSAIHGATATRQTKKYFRYQSGKGFLYTTGVLFAPNYDVTAIASTTSQVSVGARIRITTAIPHGCQIGAVIRISGVATSGYNAQYTVDAIVSDVQLDVLAVQTLGSATGDISAVPKLFMYQWSGACIRTGPHDDANGMFTEYDGSQFNVVKRTSTLQLAGTATFTAGSSTITGVNTLWTSQLKIGDRVVIKGMVHRVNFITSTTSISVTPAYRGTSNTSGNYMYLVQEQRVRQVNFNMDTVDGTGPSGYLLDPNFMQMIGIQFTWYGAGFMDFMVRGPDANFIIMHRMKQNNVNVTASMRSANLPVRYQVMNEASQGVVSAKNALTAGSSGPLQVSDVTYFPDSGYILMNYELISYGSVSRTPPSGYPTLNSLTRVATYSAFVGGTTRSFYGRPDQFNHGIGSGVELVSLTASPNMSHWGSSYIMDGGFDFDRGYSFTYTANSVSVTSNVTAVFGLRLSPSASNGQTGPLGDKELLNRAQILLDSIDVSMPTTTGATGNCAVLVTGVINPANYYDSESWGAVNSLQYGSQPSLAQVIASPTFNGYTDPTGAQSPVSGTGQKAMPGEKIFEFVANPGQRNVLDISGVKELTQSSVGGSGTFPNGSDTLYINMCLIPATSTVTQGNVSVTLRWAEAQA